MSRGRKLRESAPVEVALTGMAHRGPAVGRIDGQVVFAYYGIPGERVTVQLERRRKKYLHAHVVEVLEPSPDRTDPRCPYYGSCGGCQWQHIDYTAQVRLKKQTVTEQFARIGKQTVAIDAVHHAKLPLGIPLRLRDRAFTRSGLSAARQPACRRDRALRDQPSPDFPAACNPE